MKPAFTRMNPKAENMVVEWKTATRFDVLCVECSWEGEGRLPEAPWLVFLGHQCRLITESISSHP